MKHGTYPGPETPACAFFRHVVHAAYFQVYNVRRDFGIVWIYEMLALGIFRLDGNASQSSRQNQADKVQGGAQRTWVDNTVRIRCDLLFERRRE